MNDGRFLLPILSLAACDSGSGSDDQSWACRYHEATSSLCYGESSFNEYDECVDVYEPSRCDVITDDYTDCTGECCTDTSYSNVSVTSGSCATGGDADADTDADGWTCASSYYAAGDGCDCGCGIPDPDCASGVGCTTADCCSSGSCGGCNYCWPTSGACN
jgi:hypothetical protein